MLVSMYILCFNHQDLVKEAIEGALSQTYSPLEIVISDDCSTDNTWEVINSVIERYTGPHKIIVRKNEKNLGISAHINEVWKCCSGQWIVASAGDDVSLPNRVENTVKAVNEHPEIMLFQACLNEVDENGVFISKNCLGLAGTDLECRYFIPERYSINPFHPHGAAMAYSREVIDFFGPMPDGVIFEDNIVNVRAELLGGCALITDSLVNHRNHTGQITNASNDVPLAVQNARVKKKLVSDVISSAANVRDCELILTTGSSVELRDFYHQLQHRHRFFSVRRLALHGLWPLRLFNFSRLLIMGNWSCKITKREIVFAVLPTFLARQIVSVRARR